MSSRGPGNPRRDIGVSSRRGWGPAANEKKRATMKVGFIGLGRMGQGMARRILGDGHDLAVYDVVSERVAEFAAAGARGATSVSDMCSGREVVITMLAEDTHVIEVAAGKGGLCDSLASGSIHLAMGTYGIATIRQLGAVHAAAKQILVAAPVLGRPDLAAAGQLGIVAAGPKRHTAMRAAVRGDWPARVSRWYQSRSRYCHQIGE